MVFVKINGNRKVKSVKGGKFGYDEIGNLLVLKIEENGVSVVWRI